MADQFDLVIIGSGAAASSVAYPCREAGWSVAVIDHRPLGGTCVLRGCDPKKVLVGASDALDYAKRLTGHGLVGEVRIDWQGLMRRKRSFTDPVPESRAQSFAEAGITTIRGRATFVARDALRVGTETLRFRHAVIAAGAEPVRLGIDGEQHVITSEQFLELGQLPRRLAFIGGGYIAAEFSHLAARSGAEVTVLQRTPRLLEHFDPALVEMLMMRFRELGIDVRTGAAVQAVETRGDAFLVHAQAGSEKLSVEADLVVHAAGRAPDWAALDLASAGIDEADGRLRLNEFLQSVSNPAIYAAGDAAGMGPPLTPVAGRDGSVVADNLLHGNRRPGRSSPAACWCAPAPPPRSTPPRRSAAP